MGREDQMTATRELKPCPWPLTHNKHELFIYREQSMRAVMCSCGVCGPVFETDEEAVEAWNTRTSDGLVERIRKKIAGIRLSRSMDQYDSGQREMRAQALKIIEEQERGE